MAVDQVGQQQPKIFTVVAETCSSLETNPQLAQKHLEHLREKVPQVILALKKKKNELEMQQNDPEKEGESIRRERDLLLQKQTELKRKIDSLNATRSEHQLSLSSAESDLDRAKSAKQRAENEKGNAVTGTVAAGIGATVLGIFFPPSLIVTVPAVAIGGASAISSANREIDRCHGNISSIKEKINRVEQQISDVNRRISANQQQVSELKQKLQVLNNDLGKMKNKSVFLLKAANYLDELQVAVQAGGDRTNLLHKIVTKANKKECYTIQTSSGTRIVADSFAKAWEEVEDKVVSGDNAGFMGITFVTVPQLQ